MRQLHRDKKSAQAGAAAVEFALVLMLLLTLALPIIDYARVIQANAILINITREGANQASRGAELDQVNSQTIMNALAATTPPLTLGPRGAIVITEIIGVKEGSVVTNVVRRQYKWLGGQYARRSSAVFACPSWGGDGSCNIAGAPVANVMTGQLDGGEVIYVVEAFYDFNPFLSALDIGVPVVPQDLYSITIF